MTFALERSLKIEQFRLYTENPSKSNSTLFYILLLTQYLMFSFNPTMTALNPVQILSQGAEEEKAEHARMVSQ